MRQFLIDGIRPKRLDQVGARRRHQVRGAESAVSVVDGQDAVCSKTVKFALLDLRGTVQSRGPTNILPR